MTARRVVDRHGTADVTLLFTDTMMEDPDLYRFLDESSAQMGLEVTTIADGRSPWEVFIDVRFLGNTRADPCSRILKRALAKKWLEDNCDPEDTVVYLGFSWDEGHRADRARGVWESIGWQIETPLCEPPYIHRDRSSILATFREAGLEPPRLYTMGFPHNNCGGFCVKAGQAHFELLLRKLPEIYRWHEEAEDFIRVYLDKDVAVLRDRRGGQTKPLTLRTFRETIEAGQCFDRNEWGGCGCFAPMQGDLFSAPGPQEV